MARTPSWSNLLVPSLLILSAALSLILAPTPAAAQTTVFPDFPDILHPLQDERAKWDSLGRLIWETLKVIDFDFMKDGHVVPPGLPGSAFVTNRVCGRVSRIWIRMPFHDCGTYSILTGQGGCNGSLRKELPESTIVDGQGNVQDAFAGLNGADFAVDPTRVENTGMAASVSFFYSMKFAALAQFNLVASFADVMVYAGQLSVAMCGGPLILFVPGRIDSSTADVAGALPAPTDSAASIVRAFRRMGLMPLDGVTVISAHTTACFAAGCLDSTPSLFDNNWACETLAYQQGNPLCKFPGTFPDDAQERCVMPSDLDLANRHDTRKMIELICWNTESRKELTKRIVLTQGPYGYGSGPLWKVNLCGKTASCRSDQSSYFNLFATSYFRMVSLGLPKGWIGFSYSGAGDYNLGGAINDTPKDRDDRVRGWDKSYLFRGKPWNKGGPWNKIKN